MSAAETSGASGSWEAIGRPDEELQERIQLLKDESRNPRDGLLATLEKFKHVRMTPVGGVKTRVAPTVLHKLYRSGRTAKIELGEWLRSKELQRASISSEVTMLAMVLDRMMAEGAYEQLINSPAAELTCLRLYAIWKAYENVKCVSDWQRPKGQQSGSKWRSKVDWALADEYLKVDGDAELTNMRADDEVTEKLKRRATIAKHLQGAKDGSAAGADQE